MELNGRKKIYTVYDEIDSLKENEILNEVNSALIVHLTNKSSMDYLYKYRRGVQPILERKKDIRPEICNRIVENHAEEIVTFKNGYFLTQPAFYVARNEKATEAVTELNEYLFRSGKQQADNKLVDWFHTVGKAVLYVNSNNDDDVPYVAYALDPRYAGVVYSVNPGNAPVYAYHVVTLPDNTVRIDIITKKRVYRLSGGYASPDKTNPQQIILADKIVGYEDNTLGDINVIEYYYNSTMMSSFEAVVPLMDELNAIISNRCDGIEQFIQSLCVAVNCNFEDGVTANEIREAGMLVLKNFGEQRAEFKVLSEQLDQTQTQVAIDHAYNMILSICGVPSTMRGNGGTSDNAGAVFLRNGWETADTYARNTDDLFKESNRYFDKIVINILNTKKNIGLKISDFDITFRRDETTNILAKSQAYSTLVNGGFHPIIAMKKSGISNDPQGDYEQSKDWIEFKLGDPEVAKQEREMRLEGEKQALENPQQSPVGTGSTKEDEE